jgi:outer membrane usher protein
MRRERAQRRAQELAAVLAHAARTRDAVLRLLLAAAMTGCTTLAVAQVPARQVQPAGPAVLVLDVQLNDEARGSVLVLEANGTYYIAEDDARAWRLRARDGASLQYRERRYVALDALGLRVEQLDRGALRLVLSAPPEAFETTQLAVQGLDYPVTPAAFGGFFNYDVLGSRFAGRSFVDGAFELGAFAPFGVFTHQFVQRNLASSDDADQRHERIATTFRRDWADQLRSLELGDAVSRPGASGRALRFGGVQFQRNFALRPGFIRQPLPLFVGEAALPSTVEVFVQNQLRSVTNVPAGPFRLDNVPVILGAGEARVVVRDALGRERVVATPFYAAGGLLRPGLSDYSFAAGRLRTSGGLGEVDYGNGYGAALWRQGINDSVTVEGRGEWEEGATRVLGAGVDVGGRFGEIEVGLAVSDAAAGARTQLALGYRYDDFNNTVSLRWEQAQDGFRLAGDAPTDPTPTRTLNAVATRRLSDRWSIAASYIDVERPGFDNTRTFNLSSSLGLAHGIVVLLALNQVKVGTTSRNVASVFVNVPLGPRTAAFASVDGGSEQRQAVGIQQALPVAEGYGYRALATNYRDGTRLEAGASAQWRFAALDAELVRDRDGSNAGRVNLLGGVALVDSHAFLSRPIQDSFVLVSASGVAGAPILLNNQPAGATDTRGYLVLPRVGGFQPNEIRVDVDALPADVEVERERSIVVPPYRSGVVQPLGVRRVASAMVRVVDDTGRNLPAGAAVTVENDAATASSVANDGAFFLSGAAGRKTLRVNHRGRSCRIEIDLPASPPAEGTYHRIGPVPCRAAP